MIASVMEIFNALKMNGTANGRRMCSISRVRPARSDRESSISSSGVAIRPVTVETTIGKNVIRKVMTTRGKSDAPSVTTMMGATATIGVD